MFVYLLIDYVKAVDSVTIQWHVEQLVNICKQLPN